MPKTKAREKKQIARIQTHVDDAQLSVNSANGLLLNILAEGSGTVTADEYNRIYDRLVMAEDAIREAKLELDKVNVAP